MKSASPTILLSLVLLFSLNCSRTPDPTPQPPVPPPSTVPPGGTISCQTLDVAPDGTTCIGGYFTGSIDFDPGPDLLPRECLGIHDAFVSVFDPDGNLIWSDVWGADREDSCNAVAIAPDGTVYALGNITKIETTYIHRENRVEDRQNLVTVTVLKKYSPDGSLVWDHSWIIGNPQFVRSFRQLDLDSNGNIYFSGSFQGEVDFDPGPFEEILSDDRGLVFTCCLDPVGEFQWVNTRDAGYSGSSSAGKPVIEISDDGSFYYMYLDTNPVDNDICPGLRIFHVLTDAWERNWCEGRFVGEIFDIDSAPDGSVYVAGRCNPGSDLDPGPGIFIPQHDPGWFLLRLDPDGETLWIHEWGYGRTDDPAPDTLGNYVAPTSDPIYTDSSGNVYTITYTGGDFQNRGSNLIHRNGNEALPGTRITKFDPDGNIIWMKTWENENSHPIQHVAIDNSGNIYLATSAGRSLHAAPYGDPEVILEPFVPNYYHDGFLTKLDPDGNYLWSRQWGSLPEE